MTIQTKIANAANYKAANRTQADIGYIVIHYTGNEGDTAKNNADYFAREEGLGASAHYFVDESSVWRSVADKDVAWHCGAKRYLSPFCRNANSIGVEICMLDKQGKVRQGSIDRAAELVRTLMAQYGIPVNRVLRHFDVTGKNCPAPMVSSAKLWAEFKKYLEDDRMLTYEQFKDYMRRYETEQSKLPVSGWAASAWQAMISAGLTDGTMPQAPLTREQYAVLQQRAGVIGK